MDCAVILLGEERLAFRTCEGLAFDAGVELVAPAQAARLAGAARDAARDEAPVASAEFVHQAVQDDVLLRRPRPFDAVVCAGDPSGGRSPVRRASAALDLDVPVLPRLRAQLHARCSLVALGRQKDVGAFYPHCRKMSLAERTSLIPQLQLNHRIHLYPKKPNASYREKKRNETTSKKTQCEMSSTSAPTLIQLKKVVLTANQNAIVAWKTTVPQIALPCELPAISTRDRGRSRIAQEARTLRSPSELLPSPTCKLSHLAHRLKPTELAAFLSQPPETTLGMKTGT